MTTDEDEEVRLLSRRTTLRREMAAKCSLISWGHEALSYQSINTLGNQTLGCSQRRFFCPKILKGCVV